MRPKHPQFPDSQRRIVWRYVTGSPAAEPEPAPPATAASGEGNEGEREPAEPVIPGWQSSSYDLKHGLDVVELPTSLPRDVLDRLFNSGPR